MIEKRDNGRNNLVIKPSPPSLHGPTGKQFMRFSNGSFFFFFLSLINHMCRPGERLPCLFCTRQKPESRRSRRGRGRDGLKGKQVEGGDGRGAPCTAGRDGGG